MPKRGRAYREDRLPAVDFRQSACYYEGRKRRVFAAHPAERKYAILLDFLEQEQISKELRDGILEYRKTYPTPPELRSRVPRSRYHYYGKEVWEARCCRPFVRRKSLLAGSKATGKNVLAENLAQVLRGPAGMCPSM